MESSHRVVEHSSKGNPCPAEKQINFPGKSFGKTLERRIPDRRNLLPIKKNIQGHYIFEQNVIGRVSSRG